MSYSYSILIIFFFLIIPRPPISTLFPYTTLFRSLERRADRDVAVAEHHDTGGRSGLRRSQIDDRISVDCGSCEGVVGLGDRKSTRLNSSHTVISYAVFCLKKKKK